MKRLYNLSILVFAVSCSNYGQLTIISDLPSELDENSGMVLHNNSEVWMIEDNGNKDKLYRVNLKGKMLSDHKITDAKNHDWEDLAKDADGNLYIGDFGNNANERKNLRIYKIKGPLDPEDEKFRAERIEFNYPEQKKFPPKKSKRLYDTEAFFYAQDHLYIITKNRTRPFNAEALIYKVPAKKGKYKAELVGKFKACEDMNRCVVTAADISEDGSKIALLGYGRLWIFTEFELDDFSKGRLQSIDLQTNTQLEAVCFLNDSTLLLSDERSHGTGQNLYKFKIPKP
ncbi:NHL repeat-containing protein [Poritiphilus flavus]|uniref:SdiA-regulated n=1 Tax=Poritiphilus flavus TaxID=2697053 RepID=A0A6L9EEK5_9FLAO|nr:hypothetical protein [Poritiphilus flavus]NAS12739.1 hypothetical protein [Poritiphilus flavus]